MVELSGHLSSSPIVAVATAAGRGAVGVVRVSGPDLRALVQALCGRELKARQATYLAFLDRAQTPLDRGLAIYFPAPHSYTGEDVLELQAHGGPVVLQLLVARCLEAGAPMALRLARPGEFTERAFHNQKLDLAQAEAVSDLIEASTEAAARAAGRSLSGAFSTEINTLSERLVQLRMGVEATLDFPEEDTDFLQATQTSERLQAITKTVESVLQRAHQGALLREGMKVVLAGQPNVGKSSLLNALAGAELAIVTPIAGTTRDKVTGTLQIEGVPVHVIDTAGLRDTLDEVECLGVARTWEEIASADAVLFMHDLTRLGEAVYDAQEAQIMSRLPGALFSAGRVLHVFNKADAVDHLPSQVRDGQALSTRTGRGLTELRQKVLHLAGWQTQTEGVFSARARHVQALRCVHQHLRQAQVFGHPPSSALDLLAEELRLAHLALGDITGAFTPDDLLGEIFSRFCIGK